MSLASDMAIGYSLGRKVGDDFSAGRFAKADAKLRQELEDRAKAEGQPVENYVDEYRARIQEIAQQKGVRRRAIEVGGKRLEDDAADHYTQDLTDRGMRRAGKDMAAGDIAGGLRGASTTQYALGDLERGVKLGQAADSAQAGAEATGFGGAIDRSKLGRARAQQAAKYGDLQGAQQAESENITIAKQMSNQLYGQAAVYADAGNLEHAIGVVNGALEQDPRWGSNLSVRAGQNADAGNLYLVKGAGEDGAGGTVITTMKAAEFPGFLQTFSQDPDKMLQAGIDARSADATANREAQRDMEKEGRKLMGEIVKEMSLAGVNATTVTQAGTARAAAKQAGWEFHGAPQQGDDGVSFQLATLPDGTAVRIRFDDNPSTVEGGPTVPSMVTDMAGNPVNVDELPGGATLTEYGTAMSSLNRMGNAAQVMNLMDNALRRVDLIYGGKGGFGEQQDTGEQKDYGNSETNNYVKSIIGAIGEVPQGSPREIAEAVVDAVIQQESGGNPNAVSPKGAFGLMQLMPDTARAPGFGVTPLQNNTPEENVRLGTDYLTAMLERYGNLPDALAAYNMGPGAFDARFGGPDEAQPTQAIAATPSAPAEQFVPRGVDRFGRKIADWQPSSGVLAGKISADEIAEFTAFMNPAAAPTAAPQPQVQAAIPMPPNYLRMAPR